MQHGGFDLYILQKTFDILNFMLHNILCKSLVALNSLWSKLLHMAVWSSRINLFTTFIVHFISHPAYPKKYMSHGTIYWDVVQLLQNHTLKTFREKSQI